ncbi:hypothetical protein [Terasakiella pusilla]|uniref:hypothetical protein n=1 Tax=Terasakiella pusilla TaxID=64973 RepID=UPI003AA82660
MSEEMFGNGTADKRYDRFVSFDAGVFRTLQAQLARAEEEEAEARGTKGSAVKKIEDADFDKWAFKTAKALVNMTPTKAQERIAALLGYCLINGTFDQLDMFSRDEILKRITEIVAIANDRSGEVGLDISYAKPDSEEPVVDQDAEPDGMEEDADEAGEGMAAGGTSADPDEVTDSDEDMNGDDIDAQPEDSGAIFNAGKYHAENGGYREDCPYEDGRSKEAKLWKQGYDSVVEASEDDDPAEVPPSSFGDERPEFPNDETHVH